MNNFIEWLEKLNEKDSKVRAVLRRSIAFDPGAYVPAFPYVEPFIKEEDDPWRREMYYLVAGLWAMHWSEVQKGSPTPIGEACAFFDKEKRSKLSPNDQRKMTNTEKRFIALLDADADQLPHRLRQMVALLKEEAIDFGSLLVDLQKWKRNNKQTQNAWARQYYRII